MPNVLFSDVAQEKTHKNLLEGVEAFDTGKLKHTETQEKNPLPDKDGKKLFISVFHANFAVHVSDI